MSSIPTKARNIARPCATCKVIYWTSDMVSQFCVNCYSEWATKVCGHERYYPPAYVCERCGGRRWVRQGNFRKLCAECERVPGKWNAGLRVCRSCKQRFRNERRHINYCNDLGCSVSRRRDAWMAAANAKNTHTEAEWQARLDEYGGYCAYCKTAKGDSKDHVVPISKGGSNGIQNIVPCCLPCNSSKGNKTLAEWDELKKLKHDFPQFPPGVDVEAGQGLVVRIPGVSANPSLSKP